MSLLLPGPELPWSSPEGMFVCRGCDGLVVRMGTQVEGPRLCLSYGFVGTQLPSQKRTPVVATTLGSSNGATDPLTKNHKVPGN